MNLYLLHIEGNYPAYVKASYSTQAIAWFEKITGLHVNAWEIAKSHPACFVFDAS